MEDKKLTPSTHDYIPPDGGGPSWEPIWQRIWRRIVSWFYNVGEGGVYEERVDRTHYDRWWWVWHLISDPGEVMGGLSGWASNVYDYFQNWINPAREQLSEKVGHIQWTIRPWWEGGIWDHLFDTFDRFRDAFASFRDNPATFINDRLPQWVKDLYNLWLNAWNWIYERIPQEFKDAWKYLKDHIVDITNFFTNLYTTIKDFLSRIWTWLWEHFEQWVKDAINLVNTWKTQIGNFFTNLYTTVVDFLSRVWSWIYEHIPQVFKDAWAFLIDFLGRLQALVITFWTNLLAFLTDPYGYVTTLLQAWIEGWRDYIFSEITGWFLGFQNTITNGLVNFVISLAPKEEIPRLPRYDWLDLDTLLEKSLWWLEGDGAKQKYGYEEVMIWASANVLKESGWVPHPPQRR